MADLKARCRGPLGDRRQVELTVVADAAPTPSGLYLRAVRQEPDGQALLMASVPADRPQAFARLDREVRAGARFAQVFRDNAYPTGLSRLVAYDVDGPTPFALLEPYRGVPVRGFVGLLMSEDRPRFQKGLLLAAHHAVCGGMAHGGIGLDTVYWDDDTGTVQLVDFGNSARIGLPPPPGWRAGFVDSRADVRAIAAVIRHVVLGAEPGPAGLPDPDGLHELLDGVFADPPAAPPEIAQLLERLRVQPGVALTNLGADLAPGLDAFDAARARKLRQSPPGAGPVPPAGGPRPTGPSPYSRPPVPPPPSGPQPRRRRFWSGGGTTS